MIDVVKVVVGDAPFTDRLKAAHSVGGIALELPSVRPIHRAFREMIRFSAYDVSEMAIAVFLQAREHGRDLVMLPIAMSGDFHHRSLYSAGAVSTPEELKGGRIGVRSYSQTSGLWVRNWLLEEEGIAAADVTWLVNEGSHVPEYVDPPNVVLTATPLRELLRTGAVDAAVLGCQTMSRACDLYWWIQTRGLVPGTSDTNAYRSITCWSRQAGSPRPHLEPSPISTACWSKAWTAERRRLERFRPPSVMVGQKCHVLSNSERTMPTSKS